MTKKKETRKKFTTTLTDTHKKRLATMAGNEGKDNNDLIEKWIDEKWEDFLNEMGNESRVITKQDK